MIREVDNTFKNFLRAKGCQSIYKHIVGVVGQDMSLGLWGWGSTQDPAPGPEPGLNATSLGLCSVDLVGDPPAGLWPHLPSMGLPTPHRPAQRGLWEAPKDGGSVGDTGAWTEVRDALACPRVGQRNPHVRTHTYTLYLHGGIARGRVFFVIFFLFSKSPCLRCY